MARQRRAAEVFTLSFLDCICCGFGAVILFYTIVSAQAGVRSLHSTDALSAQVDRAEQQVQEGARSLVVLHNEIEATQSETASDVQREKSLAATLSKRPQRLAVEESETTAQRDSTAGLQADLPPAASGSRRLEAGSLDRSAPGQQLSSFRDLGGDRRYITGIRMHGKRILILLDVSASMLHEDVVSVLRLRNADDAQKREAAKWRRAVDTVSWLLTQLPPHGEYQIYSFNTTARALLPDWSGRWMAAADAPQLARSLANLHALVPADGTSLYNAFTAVHGLSPGPDQIVLITDGLPTQGRTAGTRRYVDSEGRMRLFDEAVAQLPASVPVDSILLPMLGDLQATHRFWNLARLSGGTLLMPSKDWP